MPSWSDSTIHDSNLTDIELAIRNLDNIGNIAPGPSGDTTGATDTANLTVALNALTATANHLLIPAGTYYLSGELVVPGPNVTIAGAGKNMTKLVRNSAAYGTVIRNDTMDGTVLRDFSIDGGLSGFPTNANNGIRIFDSSNVLVQRVKITNYQTNAILCFVTTAGTKSNVIYDSCEADGTGGANNGFLLVNMDESGMRHCRIANLAGGSGPNYGLQLKNNCRYSFIEDSYANNCVVGFAFGNDTSSEPSVSQCRVTGGIALNCNNGFGGAYFDHNEVEGLVIVQQAGNLEAIRLQGSAHDNAVLGVVVKGTPSPKGIVRFDDSAHDNFVEVDMVDASAGSLGEFEGTSQNNMVVVRRTGSSRPTSDKSGTSTGTGNSVWIHSRPQDQIRLSIAENMLAETFDRASANTGTAMVSGTCYFTRLPVRAGTVLTNVQIVVTTLGAGITLSKVGIYDKTGVQKAVSADQGVGWQTVGLKSIALTAPFTCPADDVLYVAFISVFSTTAPQLLGIGSIGNRNSLSSGGMIPYGAQAAQVDLPAPATIVTSNGLGYWAGIS